MDVEDPDCAQCSERSEYTALVREVVAAVESCKASHEQTQEGLSRLNSDMAVLVQQSVTRGNQLGRLVELREEEVTSAKEEAVKRSAWAQQLWSSTPVQLAIAGIVMAMLQALGVGWMAKTYFPTLAPQTAVEAPE